MTQYEHRASKIQEKLSVHTVVWTFRVLRVCVPTLLICVKAAVRVEDKLLANSPNSFGLLP